jgi:hypothetical protein
MAVTQQHTAAKASDALPSLTNLFLFIAHPFILFIAHPFIAAYPQDSHPSRLQAERRQPISCLSPPKYTSQHSSCGCRWYWDRS